MCAYHVLLLIEIIVSVYSINISMSEGTEKALIRTHTVQGKHKADYSDTHLIWQLRFKRTIFKTLVVAYTIHLTLRETESTFSWVLCQSYNHSPGTYHGSGLASGRLPSHVSIGNIQCITTRSRREWSHKPGKPPRYSSPTRYSQAAKLCNLRPCSPTKDLTQRVCATGQ